MTDTASKAHLCAQAEVARCSYTAAVKLGKCRHQLGVQEQHSLFSGQHLILDRVKVLPMQYSFAEPGFGMQQDTSGGQVMSS